MASSRLQQSLGLLARSTGLLRQAGCSSGGATGSDAAACAATWLRGVQCWARPPGGPACSLHTFAQPQQASWHQLLWRRQQQQLSQPHGHQLAWLRRSSSGGGGAGAAPPQGQSRLAQHVQGMQKKSADQGRYLVALVVGMVGLTYAAVPLYRMFCQATGYGGTVMEGKSVEDKLRQREEERNEEVEAAAAAREITINFNADVSDGLPWRFAPTQRSVRLHPGQSTLAFYTAHNTSSQAVTGVSTYNVAPQQVGQYFNKIQCFCFEEQRLRPGERIDMPVFFYLDPEFAVDPKMKGINNITLSYTFFKVDEEEAEEALTQPLPQAAPVVAAA